MSLEAATLVLDIFTMTLLLLLLVMAKIKQDFQKRKQRFMVCNMLSDHQVLLHVPHLGL